MSNSRIRLLLTTLFISILAGCAWVRNCGLEVTYTYPAAPHTEKEVIISKALRRALIDEKDIPDYHLIRDEREIVLLNRIGSGESVELLTAGALPETDEIKFILLSREQMTELADCRGGDFLYFHVGAPDIREDSATVVVDMTWAKSSKSRVFYLSGGGYKLLYRRQDGEWVFEKILSDWIS